LPEDYNETQRLGNFYQTEGKLLITGFQQCKWVDQAEEETDAEFLMEIPRS
jgi:hypothetical protein